MREYRSATATHRKTDRAEAEEHHRPRSRLWNGTDVDVAAHLAVNARGAHDRQRVLAGEKTDFTTGRKLNLDRSYDVIKEAVEAAGLACVRAA